ncbi:unnamed protein product, partial [Discosporangium mesarthrocarpum]
VNPTVVPQSWQPVTPGIMTKNREPEWNPSTFLGTLNRDSQAVAAQTPNALKLIETSEAASRELLEAEERFRRCKERFVRQQFREVLLENISRAEPLAPATLDILPDGQHDVEAEIRREAEGEQQLRTKVASLRKKVAEVNDARDSACKRLQNISRLLGHGATPPAQVLTNPTGVLNRADAVVSKGEEAMRDRAQENATHETHLAELRSKVERARERVEQSRERVERLGRDQAEAEEAAAQAERASPGAKSSMVAEAAEAKAAEVSACTEDLDQEDLVRAIGEEEALLEQHTKKRGWYRSTIAMLETVGGVRVG